MGYLETQGEQIEVMATLAYIDATLDIGWKPAQEAAFRALEPHNREGPKWADILQLFRLPRNFSCLGGTGNGGGLERFDYRCSDTGAVSVGTVFDTSPANVTLLDDLPIFLGYDYTTSPIRTDGDSSSVFAGDPARMPVAFYIRTGDNLYKELKKTGEGAQPKVYPDGFLIETTSADDGYRFFWHETKGNTGGQYQASALVITCALRLPHRVRMATGDPTSKRRKIIRHGGLHLWMADQSAIWSLDTSAVSAGASAPAKRAAAAAVAGILRDDRNALSRLHAMSVAWYGPLEKLTGQSEPDAARRSCSWSLRCCGDIASAADYDGGGVVYPDVGKLVKYISANGQRIRLMTPVSSFIYDNTNGVTTWTTDWQDLDFTRA